MLQQSIIDKHNIPIWQYLFVKKKKKKEKEIFFFLFCFFFLGFWCRLLLYYCFYFCSCVVAGGFSSGLSRCSSFPLYIFSFFFLPSTQADKPVSLSDPRKRRQKLAKGFSFFCVWINNVSFSLSLDYPGFQEPKMTSLSSLYV